MSEDKPSPELVQWAMRRLCFIVIDDIMKAHDAKMRRAVRRYKRGKKIA